MTDPMLIVFAVLAGTVGLFAWGRPRPDILAILVVLVLMFSRVLTPQESLAGFGNQVVILIAAIFIVSEGLVNTGVADPAAEQPQRVLPGGFDRRGGGVHRSRARHPAGARRVAAAARAPRLSPEHSRHPV